jgi:hypothetical protein
MIDLVFRPLAAPPDRPRRRSQFRSTWIKTLDLLEYELRELGAKDIIVQAGFALTEIRNDGWPRGGAKAKHPAVVLSFRDRKGNPLSFPCDTYDSYEDNLRAIGLSLEALRAVNRYGVTKGHEQYQGFAQIAGPPDPKRWSVDEAAVWLAERGLGDKTSILADREQLILAYRVAASKMHPDRNPEARGDWDRLQQAKSLLDAHFAAKGASA